MIRKAAEVVMVACALVPGVGRPPIGSDTPRLVADRPREGSGGGSSETRSPDHAAIADFYVWEAEHRIKNHLQLLSSYARRMGARPGITLDVFARDLAGKLAAIASAHDALQAAGSAEGVPAASFLQTLCKPYQDGAHAIEVICAPDLELAPAQLGAVGMIVSEAIANALKHAFGDGEAGAIGVSLRRRGEDLELKIGDNGQGFPAQRGERRGGLELILALTRRLRGALHIDTGSSGGAELRVVFPDLNPERALRA
jgi:two-component sensor histidine kinase